MSLKKQILNLSFRPENAEIRITGDDAFQLFVNGEKIGEGKNHTIVQQYDIAKFLKRGENILSFRLYNNTGPSGLLFEGSVSGEGKNITFASGEATLFSKDGTAEWSKAHLGGVPPTAPWGPLTILVVNRNNDNGR